MIGLRARPLPSGEETYLPAIDPPSVTRPREPLAPARFAGRPTAIRGLGGGPPALPAIAPGQLWVVETLPSAAPLRPFELDAFSAANVVIYDRSLTPLVAAALPLGSYAEPAAAAQPALERPEIERILRLTLDGWSVVRLLDGALDAADRAERLHRIAAHLRGAGIAAELPVQLIGDTAGGYETTDAALGDMAEVLDAGRCERRVTAVFATRRGGGGPLRAIVDNGLAG